MHSTVIVGTVQNYTMVDGSRDDRTGHVRQNRSTGCDFRCRFIYSILIFQAMRIIRGSDLPPLL